MGNQSRPTRELLSKRSGLARWSLAGGLGLALHGGALLWLVPTDVPTSAIAAPEAVVMIDLPPEPELPPIESVEQAAVEEVVETTPEELPEQVTEPELVDTSSEPKEIETIEPLEELAAVSTEPEMLPPSEVALPLPPPPPPEMVETTEVKPKPKAKKPAPKKVERRKPLAKKTPEVSRPPVDAQAAGAGAGREAADALAAYRSTVRRAIVRKRRASDANGAVGRATVSLSISRDGSIAGLSVGGSPVVSSAAERLILRVGRFPPVPQSLDAPFRVTVPIDFKRE